MAKPASPIRLLVVAGDADERASLRRRFTRVGYEVMDAADAAKAQSLISMIPFDLALLDMDTPDIGGLAALSRIRENRSPAELPIIMLAPEGSSEDMVEALNLGANDCLAKPLDFEVACARAEMQIRRKHQGGAGRALQVKLVKLEEAVVHAQNASAPWRDVGHEVRAPLAGVLGAASVLASVCRTPELKTAAESVESSTAALEVLIRAALENGERRARAPKTKVRVLSADDDAQSRLGIRNMLHAAETEVELVEVGTGLQAALAAESVFFDLILVNIATAEAVAGIRAIRRAERQNKMRRTPLLAIAREGDDDTAAKARDAGADLYMTQPVTAEALLTALAGAIGRQSDDLSAVA